MEQRQDNQDQIIYSRIERVIAYKNIQFILEDFLQELSVFFHLASPSFRDFFHYTPPPRRGQAACPARALGLSAAKQENARRQKP